jgi:hypothetical protein
MGSCGGRVVVVGAHRRARVAVVRLGASMLAVHLTLQALEHAAALCILARVSPTTLEERQHRRVAHSLQQMDVLRLLLVTPAVQTPIASLARAFPADL